MASQLRALPAYVLVVEYFLGGIPRLSPVPLRALHERIRDKSRRTAPHLRPVFPFPPRGGSDADVRHQMRCIGALMVATGLLLALPATRGSPVTLALECFLTGAGAWSQMRAGLVYWLPCVNFVLAWVVWAMERR
ncbi:hypothetical protein JX265_011013 [Neoarthrinium moseri]|uniref:Uncharacterized protein n=1 Tax=Neoarthrinium moseri TaxID=1658444 RepID=A0A9P9WDE1_9PEZI|nr:uncharacterized protein JN550_009623 [Neoarthrinium moseri]KAI1851778.1 hypothetical protein JX266_003240 [Neoarthrinium moseri]KAI1857983.1 hypothetical protein JX265_011013 [Neoarthrinium moseri]KAI1863303.1 hypothetical protein JN550_009623 [Neoarthrinium moseri]